MRTCVLPQANKTLAKATVEAAAINATANVRYDAIRDKYAQFAILLSNAKSVHNLSSEATLTYLANAIVGGGRKQQVAIQQWQKTPTNNKVHNDKYQIPTSNNIQNDNEQIHYNDKE